MARRFRTTASWLFLLASILLIRGAGAPAVAGIIVMIAGLAFRTWAAGVIRKNRSLAVAGPYRLCRHPLYFGSFLFTLGVTLIVSHPAIWAAFLIFFPLLYLPTILGEEEYLAAAFPDDFPAYRRSVPAFLPRLRRPTPAEFSWRQVTANGEFINWFTALLFILLTILRNR